MSDTAMVAISSSNAALASAEASRAAEEHRQACIAMMPTYSDRSASVESKKAYASCVETVYPNPMTPVETVGLKLSLIVILAFMVFGFIRGLDGDRDLLGRFMGALIWLLAGVSFILIAAAVGYVLGV